MLNPGCLPGFTFSASTGAACPVVPLATSTVAFSVVAPAQSVSMATSSVPVVPFYSQFDDITSKKWKPAGCGITSLAMLIEYYKPKTVDVDTLLGEGLDAGAFSSKAGGWTYDGLIEVSQKYGLDGQAFDFGKESRKIALAWLSVSLMDGPVMASVHYKFDPKSKIPHLVVINGIDGDNVYYNDPASKEGGNLSLPLKDFLASWKQRFIVIRPTTTEAPRVAMK
ncbi:MAG: C39 family peptidase [Candidatus Paceibacterota bacterium]